jgi:4-diphosphocytidyl-2-C-methyl-D-erythritol kinase
MAIHRIFAPAKLNRFLAVLGKRADGFHELELVTTVLAGVPDLSDFLEGEPADTLTLSVLGPTSSGIQVDESNLVLRAWRLLEKESNRALPARLHLEKRIPHGAGLGGGSSDAAAALKLGNGMFGLQLSDSKLLRLAAELGSDVPLFLLGGTVLGLGRGERVFPLRPIPLEPLLLVHPNLHVSTPSVYQILVKVGYPHPDGAPSLPEDVAPPWRNDLTNAAIRICPALADVRRVLLDTGGEPLLCGSGSCWASRYPTLQARNQAAYILRNKQPEWSCWPLGNEM